MQIKSLVFYNTEGEIRILPFEIGKVNIITGESKTGKTALIDIVNYCLGSDDCRISEGVIRDTVAWFGIQLQLETEQVFIARQNPNRLNQISTQYVYFSNADVVDIPPLAEINNNSDIVTLKDFFTKKLFIAEFTNQPESGTRDALSVNFKHSRFYSFQPQDLIAQRNFLFYSQSDSFIAQAIKDTLPYFLGVLREDTIRIEQEIASKKRELNRTEKELKEYNRLLEDGSNKTFELIEEAKQLNLLYSRRIVADEVQAIEALKEVLIWDENMEVVVQEQDANLKRLLDESEDLSKQLGVASDHLKAVQAFVGQTTDYSVEASQQKVRLESIKLFGESESEMHSCPLCSQTIHGNIPSIQAINNSLTVLSKNLSSTIVEKPKLSKHVEKLILEEERIKRDLETRQNGIKAIYREKDESRKLKDINLRRGKIIGKISLFLESYKIVQEDGSLKNKINLLRQQIKNLEELVSLEEKESRLNAVLNQINNQMTQWASGLDLEHQDAPIRFDIKKLNIFADTPTKSIALNHMGSGANWVAYHLLIHFALHRHFVKAKRPVPRFLILDQPSQIYFPPEKDLNQSGEILASSDETAVKQMYEFIFKVTKELSPDFQVIIMDHAKLSFGDFTDSITEEWRNGQKLIPMNWISNK